VYTKYYLVITSRTLGIVDLPVRNLNASRFCRFYVDIIEVLCTSILPLPGDACWFSRARSEQRLLLYIVVMPWEGKPSTLLYWKIPCVGARILRHSCSNTTLVLPPSALLTCWASVTGWLVLPPSAPLTCWASVAGWLVRSMGWRSRLRLRPPAEGQTYVHTYYGRAIRRVYLRFLVLTPQAGTFIPGGLALVDGTIRGSSSRLLVKFPL